jgi:hypothetical protein
MLLTRILFLIPFVLFMNDGMTQITERDKGFFVPKPKAEQTYLPTILKLKNKEELNLITQSKENSTAYLKMLDSEHLDNDSYNYYKEFFAFYDSLSVKIKTSLSIDELVFIYAFDEENYKFIKNFK